ncbi:TPA: hypothetical protein H1005_04355 [archaeon]|uniref:Uncharacterized protein n=1 Tax=Candidatus Naiadarchaeum limnaeum TaxID=2756139 RepID=A0A832US88_9ARCH|nr:hypothetical protein [Candidatus Naiadarchaeales archaeon SRR2090153.bin1042]HIK00602.1 hypothetical protein [Candidatus Naiadarchaeum limnaeum]
MKKQLDIRYGAVTPPPFQLKLFYAWIDEGIDALILETYAAGGLPTKRENSYIPLIRKAAKKRTPLFLIYGSLTGRPAYTEWSNFKEKLLPGVYEPEVDAIKAGAIYLERDKSQLEEVISGIKEIFETITGYEKRIKAVMKRFNSPEFNRRLLEIKNG